MNDDANNRNRPEVWIGHVAIYSPRPHETLDFMLCIGMRAIIEDDEFGLLELRGGTHLIVTSNADSDLIRGEFDLMVDDIDAMHARLDQQGYSPGAIDRGEIHDSFHVTEPGGSRILFNSSHVGDLPV